MTTLHGRIAAEVLPFRTQVAVTALLAVLWAVWASGPGWMTPALVVAAAAGAALSVVDARTQRLPNALTYPATAAVAVLLVLSAVVTGEWAALGRAAAGGAGLCLAYLVLHLVNPSGMGLGDVKLAPLLGAVAAWSGWSVLLWAAALPFLVGGVWAVALLAARRAGRKTALAFGPFMLVGTALALTWARLTA